MIIEIPYQPGSLSIKLKEDLKSEFLKNENKIISFIPFNDENINYKSLINNKSEFFIQNAQNHFINKIEGYSIAALIKNSNEGFNTSETLLMVKTENLSLYPWIKKIDNRSGFGKVSITGFGPGDPDLLTIKAYKAIENAEIIFHDDLIDKNFLNKFSSKKVYVGKRKGNHSFTQDQINLFLYQSALIGKNTVRLKGGDPFIFGRGGEELEYLQQKFIEVEVIPGISAAFGAASGAQIPLTLRGVSTSVAFCTGFPRLQDKIPNADTLVFYMSSTILNDTAQHLLNKGLKSDTPVALIRNASLKNQQTVFTNLETLSTGTITLASPMIAIIGEVAREKSWNNQINHVLKSNPLIEAV
jgi:uroporphyrinogen III methyltransferase/synthase